MVDATNQTLEVGLTRAPSPRSSRGPTATLQCRAISRRSLLNALALGGGDMLALGFAVAAAEVVEHRVLGSAFSVPFWVLYLVPVWFSGAIALRLLPGWGMGPVEELRRVTTLIVAAYGTLIVTTLYGNAVTALYVSASAVGPPANLRSGLCLGSAMVASAIAVPWMRTSVRRRLLSLGHWGIPAFVFGRESARESVMSLLDSEKGMGYTPVLPGDPSAEGGTDGAFPQAVAVLVMEGMERTEATRLLEGPLAAYRTVIVVPDLLDSPSLWVRPRDLRGVIGLEFTSNLSSRSAQFTKRATDMALVLATAPLWLPLCLLVAALIWIEDGRSPLFQQERVGAGGRPFRTLKFRTMYPDAEAILRRRLDTDPGLRQEWESTYKLRVDPRITRVGRLLRATSLDELPQLVNVLRGDMSLVGPRPLPQYHHEVLSPKARRLRERVRPGITGLWQVSGRSEIGNEGMELWDPYYVRNWSLWLDTVILVRTVRAVLQRSGAY